MPKDNFDYIMDDLYCIDCYVLFSDKQLYDEHLEQCQRENRIDHPPDAEEDFYWGGGSE